jgi:hypothetical protein
MKTTDHLIIAFIITLILLFVMSADSFARDRLSFRDDNSSDIRALMENLSQRSRYLFSKMQKWVIQLPTYYPAPDIAPIDHCRIIPLPIEHNKILPLPKKTPIAVPVRKRVPPLRWEMK